MMKTKAATIRSTVPPVEVLAARRGVLVVGLEEGALDEHHRVRAIDIMKIEIGRRVRRLVVTWHAPGASHFLGRGGT